MDEVHKRTGSKQNGNAFAVLLSSASRSSRGIDKQDLVDQIVFTTKAQRHEEFCDNITSNPSACFFNDFHDS